MKLIRAKVLGFCMGVRRAVEMAERETASFSRPVYTMGPLIHNPQTLASLAERGVRILDEENLPDLGGAVVIIRAHGISPLLEKKLRAGGARIVDATCPRVKASQLAARDLAEKGYRIFLAGERDHGEVKGIYGYAAGIEGVCVIVGNPEEAASAARSLRERGDGKTALIGQSTISRDEYLSIAEEIQRIFPHLEVKETICGATRDRQDALRELCARVDAVIVAGGKASANTRRLLAIAGQCGKPCLLAESAADLPEGLDRYPSVGLCAGASTPDSVIAGIEEKLRAL